MYECVCVCVCVCVYDWARAQFDKVGYCTLGMPTSHSSTCAWSANGGISCRQSEPRMRPAASKAFLSSASYLGLGEPSNHNHIAPCTKKRPHACTRAHTRTRVSIKMTLRKREANETAATTKRDSADFFVLMTYVRFQPCYRHLLQCPKTAVCGMRASGSGEGVVHPDLRKLYCTTYWV